MLAGAASRTWGGPRPCTNRRCICMAWCGTAWHGMWPALTPAAMTRLASRRSMGVWSTLSATADTPPRTPTLPADGNSGKKVGQRVSVTHNAASASREVLSEVHRLLAAGDVLALCPVTRSLCTQCNRDCGLFNSPRTHRESPRLATTSLFCVSTCSTAWHAFGKYCGQVSVRQSRLTTTECGPLDMPHIA